MCVDTLPVFIKLLPDSRLWEGYGLYLAIPAVEGRGEERGGERDGSEGGGGRRKEEEACKRVEGDDVGYAMEGLTG